MANTTTRGYSASKLVPAQRSDSKVRVGGNPFRTTNPPGRWHMRSRLRAPLDSVPLWNAGSGELDDERLLVLFRHIARGKSGLEMGEIGAKGASVVHVRDGKVTKLVHYFDRERAFADLGLKE